jgi:2-polyprenyl-3-methyl-5-hydroxy-6-metoxy-1,4-benzoquinol methylase
MKLFSTSNESTSLGNYFRNKRFVFFENKLRKLSKPIRILDVGGVEEFWANRNFVNKDDYQITCVNLKSFKPTSHNIKSAIGDATNLDFSDNEFDVIFSNSVIEHLYTYENQVKMAKEVVRLGKHYFVQTPNKKFFIEPHYVVPFFQFIPRSMAYWILTKTRLSRGIKWDPKFANQYLDEIKLLTKREMRELFPGANIYCERFAGFTKSFTAHNFEK